MKITEVYDERMRIKRFEYSTQGRGVVRIYEASYFHERTHLRYIGQEMGLDEIILEEQLEGIRGAGL